MSDATLVPVDVVQCPTSNGTLIPSNQETLTLQSFQVA